MSAKLLALFWRINFSLSALFGWACLAWLLSAPSEPSSAVLLGYSFERLVLALLLTIPSAAFTFWAVKGWLDNSWLGRVNRSVKSITASTRAIWAVWGLGLFILIVCWVLFFLPQSRAILFFGSLSLYIERVKPLLLYAILLSLLWLPQFLFIQFGIDTKDLADERGKFRLGLVILLLLLGCAAGIGLTGLGLGFDATIWNAPGAPVLSSQVFLCLLLAPLVLILTFWLRRWWQKRKGAFSEIWVDLALATLVWLLAALLWIAQPAAPTYYSSPPLPPNNQSYPLSDAFNHDVIANNVLIGEGFTFGGQVAIRRPAYVLVLAGLEALLGADYDAVVSAQVLLLALFPALLYLLGARLHNRFSGLLLAGLVSLREANSIALGDVINTSHAKLLMVDLPAALMMAAVALAVVVWLRGQPRNWLAALLVGGLLGWAILMRSQSLTLLPFLGLLALLVWGWRAAWRPVLLLALGALIVATPWILRNRALTGQWVIEDAVVSGFLANRYSFTPGTFVLPFLPGESEGEYYARQMGQVREFVFQNPGYVAGFVADNFVRNQMLNFMAMPVSLQLRDAESHVRELPYWPSWEGGLDSESYLPVLAGLFLVSLGMAVAWKQAGWVGLVPLVINFGFTANLALARVSGWRYNLPVDWTVLLYYALGLGQLLVWGLLLLRGAPWAKKLLANFQTSQTGKTKTIQRSRPMAAWTYAPALVCLLLLGSSFLIIEGLSQPRYAKVSHDQAVASLTTAKVQTETERQQVLELLSAGQLDVASGRALHPRYLRAGEGLSGIDFVLVAPMDFGRLTFYLIGPEPASVIMAIDELAIDFPASSDVLVFRCAGAPEAAAIIAGNGDGLAQLVVSSRIEKSCITSGS